MTPINHLCKAAELCIRSHERDLSNELYECVNNITVNVGPDKER